MLTKSWVAPALPRELRYIYLVTRAPSHSPELTRLPWYMKELHLYQRLSGTIDLRALPANMTMLNVFGRIEVIALVNNETLPAPLKGVRLVDRGGKGSVKLVSVNGSAVDPRVKKAKRTLEENSRWCAEFQKDLRATVHDLNIRLQKQELHFQHN